MMKLDYQRISAAERDRHHDELRDEGFDWCPDCGEALIWDLPTPCKQQSAGGVPVVSGDWPPLTAEQLVAAPTPRN